MIRLLKILCVVFPFALSAQESSFRVYLIGDAGEDTVSGKALMLLREELLQHPESAVVFLGDNVYPSGLKINDRVSKLHLQSQLNVLTDYKGQVYFIPGNHDWAAQGAKGLRILKDQQVYIDDHMKNSAIANKNKAVFFPEDGLPGPASVMLNDKLRLVMIDTQWFLHLHKKNKTGTKKHTKELFYAQLDSLLSLAKKNNEQVIITAHHPMFTNGQHSKKRQPFRFLVNCTPFQLFGLAGIDRLLSQDIDQPRYKKMRKKMIAEFGRYNNIMFASGHDHNLQCFKEGTTGYIVSGGGSKLSLLQKKKRFDSVFQDDSKTGFIELQYSTDGKHTTTVFRVGEEKQQLPGF